MTALRASLATFASASAIAFSLRLPALASLTSVVSSAGVSVFDSETGASIVGVFASAIASSMSAIVFLAVTSNLSFFAC